MMSDKAKPDSTVARCPNIGCAGWYQVLRKGKWVCGSCLKTWGKHG